MLYNRQVELKGQKSLLTFFKIAPNFVFFLILKELIIKLSDYSLINVEFVLLMVIVVIVSKGAMNLYKI